MSVNVESIGMAVGGLVAVIAGVTLFRCRERFSRFNAETQQQLYGERVARWTARGNSPNWTGAFAIGFALMGLLFIVMSPWASSM
jgi:multisubunit Na+/H+ antiporter MnhG subunit